MTPSFRIAGIFAREGDLLGSRLTVRGWVRTRRDSKSGVHFIELNDGSTLRNLQVVADASEVSLAAVLPQCATGAALEIEGVLAPSPASGQSAELAASRIVVLGGADPEIYPLQKKRHTLEYLREIAHLRPRTNTIGAAARVRSRIAHAVHAFFEAEGFFHIHTPIITASDCEGAGEVFRVTRRGEGPGEEFFGRPVSLTVSGQLEAEAYALALSRVYTFGPTFRAENSNTARHLAEFWMIEPEAAFFDLEDLLALAQGFLRACVGAALERSPEDVAFFERFYQPGLGATLRAIRDGAFTVMTYTEAVSLLAASGEAFAYPVSWGCDLQAEHERWLTEKKVGGAVAVINYPRALKPFYMRVNDDETTVAAVDVLVPGVGEIIGGSRREERLDMLVAQMREKGMNPGDYQWYLDLRRFGSAPHAGFGAGLERLVQMVTGLPNIRDVIAFPRTPGHAEF